MGKDGLQKIIDTSNTYKEVLEKLGLSVIANNYKTLNKYIKEYNIFTDEIEKRRKISMSHPIYTKEVFVKAIEEGTCTLKPSRLLKKLIDYNIKEYKCDRCGINKWNHQDLTLELHHINGDHSDNHLKNLEILCPNCHSQTQTYRFKNRKH